MRPKLDEPMLSEPGTSRFSRLNRFENAIPKRRRAGGTIGKLLPTVIEKVRVPGPISVPTAQVPNRPMLLAGCVKAVRSKYASAVGSSMLPPFAPVQSGRCADVKPRVLAPVPDGSPLLNEGVRNVP